MGVTNTLYCTFCNEERDSIEHFFWNCQYIQLFWTSLEQVIREKCENAVYVKISQNVALFGCDNNIKTDEVFDYIILLSKLYIYKCKMQSSPPNIQTFQKELKFRYKLEEHNARLNCDLLKFNINWYFYKQIFQDLDN